MDAARPIIMDEIWMYTCIIAFNLAVIFGGFTYVKKKGITCEIYCYKMLIGGGFAIIIAGLYANAVLWTAEYPDSLEPYPEYDAFISIMECPSVPLEEETNHGNEWGRDDDDLLKKHGFPLDASATKLSNVIHGAPIETRKLWDGFVVPDGVKPPPEAEAVWALFNATATDSRTNSAAKQVDNALPRICTSLVVSYCSHSLDWLAAYLDGMDINDVTIYSKCNQTDALVTSHYMHKIHAIASGGTLAAIHVLPNVGGCDHTYAYDMAHRDWSSFASRSQAKHVVMYLKDNPTALCSANLESPSWSVLEPSTLVHVAAMPGGFSCLVRSRPPGTLWHNSAMLRLYLIETYERAGGTVNVSEDAHHFADTNLYRNLGAFGDAMGISMPQDVVQVCYKGNFAVAGAQFVKNPEKVKVAERIMHALSRGNNIVEGHYVERLWASFLQASPSPRQALAIRKANCQLLNKGNYSAEIAWQTIYWRLFSWEISALGASRRRLSSADIMECIPNKDRVV